MPSLCCCDSDELETNVLAYVTKKIDAANKAFRSYEDHVQDLIGLENSGHRVDPVTGLDDGGTAQIIPAPPAMENVPRPTCK